MHVHTLYEDIKKTEAHSYANVTDTVRYFSLEMNSFFLVE